MSRRTPLLLSTCCASLCLGIAANAQLAISTFDANADGWLTKSVSYPTTGAPPVVLATFTPQYSSTGGNPGGYINETDPDGNTTYWFAPAKFLGNKPTAYQGHLSYDLIQTAFNGTPYDQEDVILVGTNGVTLAYNTPNNPTAAWTHYDVGLTEAGWHVGNVSGSSATAADMQGVLTSLSALYIRAEFINGSDTDGLDNVVLSPVPAPTTLITTLMGSVPGLMALRRRRR